LGKEKDDTEMKKSRAEIAGEQLGRAIVEMVNLMYQNNTVKNFWKGLRNILESNQNYEKTTPEKVTELLKQEKPMNGIMYQQLDGMTSQLRKEVNNERN
jgi:hypothetical protein